ncbi:NAD(P)/FAD-dependent oxidoreductase [Halobacillus sp. Marseille-Q1614]|uniref:NAD(P)/FAD-dependent oxidoreductase n=1 Tax=Halobacillus sp. Marseille-Q1614 TaxID=2709134 RepID=UPI00156E0955|nr:NAD(P)/FAD-dependent oxidoreductase [Halobacillus sp. Marseille-Q1614]
MKEQFDLTIIGGGTTGLYAAFYAGMRNMKTKVIEYQPGLGGKVSFFYPEKKIYDVGGFLGVTGEELVHRVEEQAGSIEPEIVTDEKVKSIEKQVDGSFILHSEDGNQHLSKTVIVASGLGTFDMKPLNVPQLEKYNQKFIHYTIQNIKQYEGKKAVVVSDSRVGIDWALALEKIAKEVHIINHSQEFKAVYEQDVERLEASSVRIHRNTKVSGLEGSETELTGVVLENRERLDAEHVLVYEGLKIEKSLYQEWGLETEKGRIPVEMNMGTNIEGIFAAGDAALYPHKTMLIASGFTEAMTAVNAAKSYIDPKSKSQVYSTVIYKHS